MLPFLSRPSFFPSFLPSFFPSLLAGFLSSFLPSFLPSFLAFLPCLPSFLPSLLPYLLASFLPRLPPLLASFLPSLPSFLPSLPPSFLPSLPSFLPSLLPSFLTSFLPSFLPCFLPSFLPSFPPSLLPSFLPPLLPSFPPSFLPSFLPPPFFSSLQEPFIFFLMPINFLFDAYYFFFDAYYFFLMRIPFYQASSFVHLPLQPLLLVQQHEIDVLLPPSKDALNKIHSAYIQNSSDHHEKFHEKRRKRFASITKHTWHIMTYLTSFIISPPSPQLVQQHETALCMPRANKVCFESKFSCQNHFSWAVQKRNSKAACMSSHWPLLAKRHTMCLAGQINTVLSRHLL